MTVPNRSISIRNGGNGVSVAGTMARAVLGVSSTGTINQVYAFTSPTDVGGTHGIGPLVDAASLDLEAGGGTVLTMRVKDSVAGTITTGSAVETGSGTCTLSGTPNNRYRIAVEVTTAGNLGVGAFRVALDAGPDDTKDELRNWSLPIAIPTGATYVIPGTGLTLTFGGTAFVMGDTWTFSTTAPSFQLADLNAALDALKAYVGTKWLWIHVAGEITAAIATGVKTKVEGWETADHKYRFAILEAADVNPIGVVTATGTSPPAVPTISGIPSESWDMVLDIVTGGALETMTYRVSTDGGNTYGSTITSTTGAEILGSTGMSVTWVAGTYPADAQYTFSTWDKEINRAVWDAALKTAYVAFSSDRVMVCAGFGECTLPSGKIVRAPIAWGVSPLLASIDSSTDPGQIEDAGTLPGFVSISHNEALHPGLDDAGFTTARTWDTSTAKGIYLNQGRMAASAGSDYDLVQYRRVMDDACEALDGALVKKVSKKTRVDATTGFILEADARVLDRAFLTPVEDVTVKGGHASAASCKCVRNENLLSTRLMTVDLEIIGVAYVKNLAARIGYKNPVLQPVQE